MVKLLHTPNPDNGTTVPVVLDSSPIDVTGVVLFRADVEGSGRALNADVSFDTSVGLPEEGREHLFEVFLYVLTEGHVATMMDSMVIKSVSELQTAWDMATVSGGSGDIHALLVKTVLHAPDSF